LKATRAGEADNIDVLDKCNYLGAILENTEGGLLTKRYLQQKDKMRL
jgi:hypothetical protein